MISTKIQIRFADIDMGGHVHNGAYLHYFESARMNFFVGELGQNWDWKKHGFIVKKNTVEYNIPIYLSDTISVEVNCIQIGEKSFTLSYHVLDQKNQLKTYGESVIVCFDYIENVTIPIPNQLLIILQHHFNKKDAAQ